MGEITEASGHEASALAVLSSFFVWVAFYNILCLSQPSRSFEWHCRIVTLAHALIISAMSFIFGMYYNPWLFTDAGGPNTVYEVVTLTVCLGYFLFDLAWCLYFWGHETNLMLLHHFLSVMALSLSLFWGVSGTEVNGVIFGSEISNPLLQVRWFLKETNNAGTWMYEINDILFMLVFFVCRICIGTYLFYTHYQNPRPLKFVRVGAVGMYVVGWCFMIGIFQFAVHKYSKMYQKWQAEKKRCMAALANSGSKIIENGGKLIENGIKNGTAKKMN